MSTSMSTDRRTGRTQRIVRMAYESGHPLVVVVGHSHGFLWYLGDMLRDMGDQDSKPFDLTRRGDAWTFNRPDGRRVLLMAPPIEHKLRGLNAEVHFDHSYFDPHLTTREDRLVAYEIQRRQQERQAQEVEA